MTQEIQDPNALPQGKDMSADQYSAFTQFVGRHQRLPTNAELAAVMVAKAGKNVASGLMGGKVRFEEPTSEHEEKPEDSPATVASDPDAVVNAKNLSGPEFQAVQEYLRVHGRVPTNGQLAKAISEGQTRHRGFAAGGSARRGIM